MFYSTFDSKIGEELQRCEGVHVRLLIKRGENGNDVLAIVEE